MGGSITPGRQPHRWASVAVEMHDTLLALSHSFGCSNSAAGDAEGKKREGWRLTG